jgi:hypothetical protein
VTKVVFPLFDQYSVRSLFKAQKIAKIKIKSMDKIGESGERNREIKCFSVKMYTCAKFRVRKIRINKQFIAERNYNPNYLGKKVPNEVDKS